ncbi:hypothetical protein C2E23DRAFT_886012 [Lenzites betulinus]|nr:hypothetical protein C2E23DRAFT_886012 [Lenzites betulinus]
MAAPTAAAAISLYQVLGIDKMRKAYRKRALQTHPDRLPQNATPAEKKAAEEQFRLVNNAYEVLNNEENRKLYDKHNVWPPPSEQPGYARDDGRNTFRNDAFSNDPFFASPSGFNSRGGFVFTDPFELFNSLFGDVHRAFDNDPFFAGTPFSHSPFDDPFFRTPFGQSPFHSSFMGPMFGGSMFGSPFAALMNGPMLPQIEGGSSRTYSSRTEAIGQNGQWVSRSQMTRTINGRTEVITKRVDAQGNEHVNYASPDGERYTINGVEQPSSRRIETPRRSETAPQPRQAPRAIADAPVQPASNYVNQQGPAQSYNVPITDSAYARVPPANAYLSRSHSHGSHHSSHRSRTSAEEPPRRSYTTRTSPTSAHPPADAPVNGHTRHIDPALSSTSHPIPQYSSAPPRAPERLHNGYGQAQGASTRGYDAGGSNAHVREPQREYSYHSRDSGRAHHAPHHSSSRPDSREYYPDRERARAREWERERERTAAAAPEQGPQPYPTHGHSAQQQQQQRGWRGCGKKGATPKVVTFGGQKFHPNVVLDTFFVFVAERHRIQQRRLLGEPQPWTTDAILAAYPFTNVFRVYDRVTQYILHNVIERGDQSLREQCFRVMLFRSFNKMETWELLTARFGELTWRDFDVNAYDEVLLAEQQANPLYGHAYIIPSPKLGGRANASNHLRLIQLMMEEDLPGELQKLHHLKDAHGRIALFPSMGDFMALQLLLDLNMTAHFNYPEDEWVALGPGSQACLLKIFGPAVRGFELDALRYLHRTQHAHFARLRVRPDCIPRVPGRAHGLSMVDLEHALCECEKYSRAFHPSIVGKRQKVAKRAFTPRPARITADVPAHWLKGPRRRESLTRPKAIVVGGEQHYEVSHIVAERRNQSGNDTRYLVRWLGWGPDDDTVQRESDLVEGAPEVLEEWRSAKQRIATRATEMLQMGVRFRSGKKGASTDKKRP